MRDRGNVNNHSRPALDHAGDEGAIKANGTKQVDLQNASPILIREHFEPARLGFCPADVIDQNIESAPLLLNAIDHLLHARDGTDVRLYEEDGSLVFG